MDITSISVKLSRPDRRGRPTRVKFLVDSGAVYSVLPETVWRKLSLKPARTMEFSLADGSVITRGVSECRFEIHGIAATSPAVLGAKNDGPLLGVVTLETLGLMLNPLSRDLLPMHLPLMRL